MSPDGDGLLFDGGQRKAAVVSVDQLGSGSGRRTCPWWRSSAATACRRLPRWMNSPTVLPSLVLLAPGPSRQPVRTASIEGLGPEASTGGRGLEIGHCFLPPCYLR